jgi:capsular exopolysaccharide synthesis family protein
MRKTSNHVVGAHLNPHGAYATKPMSNGEWHTIKISIDYSTGDYPTVKTYIYDALIAQNTADFIDKRIELISKELNTVEDSYESFMEANQLVDLKMDASAYIAETNEARKQLLALETELAVSNYLTEYLIKHSNDEQPIPVLGGLGTASTALATQIAEYNKLLMERTRRTENASDQNPRIRELNKYITGLYASIKAGLESNIKALELKLADARKQDRKVNARINKLPEKQRRAIDIERQKVLKEALYTYLLNKREEVALQLAIEEANVRLVEEPMATGGPVSPRSSMILFASFIIGLLIPSGILFLLEQFNTKAKRRHDIEKATNVPIVGEIPEWKNHQDAQTIADVKSDSPISEAFRVLRYQLDFFRHNAKVYVVTSSTPHQGKSFTSKNLATVLGMAERKVLIVDADIRKRSISRALSNTKRQGLTSYLNEEAGTRSLASYVEKDSVYPGVDFLPGGIMPPNPTELLMSARLEELIEEAKQTYDYIVIDTTPMLSVADASIVDRVADVTLFVIRMGVEELSFLPQLDKLNRDKKLRNMALVLNDIDLRKSYGYGYGYGYSYGYGYGENHGKKKRKGLFGKK